MGPELFDEFEAEFHSDTRTPDYTFFRDIKEAVGYDLVKYCTKHKSRAILDAFDWSDSYRGLMFWLGRNESFAKLE